MDYNNLMRYDNSQVRRQDRLLDEARARELIATAEYGVLSMVDRGSKPYGVPVNFVFNEDCIYIHCATQGRKLDCIDLCEDVSFCIVGRTNLLPSKFTTEYESVIITGCATIITDEQERMDALQMLLEKYSPHDVKVGMKYARASFSRTELIRIDIDTFSGKCKRMQ